MPQDAGHAIDSFWGVALKAFSGSQSVSDGEVFGGEVFGGLK